MNLFFVFLSMLLFISAASADEESVTYQVDGKPYEGYYISPSTDKLLQLSESTRGPECPTSSGTYCSEEYNHCCMIKGEWTCVVELKDCKDE